MKKILAKALAITLLCSPLSGCSDSGTKSSVTDSSLPDFSSTESVLSTDGSDDSVTDSADTDVLYSDEDMFTERDKSAQYSENDCISITLGEDRASCDSESVKISESTVTITEEGCYIISGKLSDGMIIVDADDSAKIQLVLNGADITSKSSAALYILNADKVFVTLADGSQNKLSNGDGFVAIDDNSIDGAVFSKEDLTFNGSGSLIIDSPDGHGIVCKDDLVFTGGNFLLTSSAHGIDANDSVRITGMTTLDIKSGKDSIHCENSDDTSLGFVYISGGDITVDSQGDGISAGSDIQIAGGQLDIISGGGSANGSAHSSDGFMGGHGGMRPEDLQNEQTDENSVSAKAVKAVGNVKICGGTFVIDSADDSIHSDSSVTIDGGEFEIASGDDAFHSEKTLTVNNGVINISESYEGLEALDIRISGGEVTLSANDDGLNAAGGVDSSGNTGGRDGMFGGPGGGHGGPGGSGNSNGSIVISGGKLDVTAYGDGIDANGTIEISGGYIVVSGPVQGDTATLDYDRSASVTGGTFIGTGAMGMAQTFSDSSQGLISVSVGNQAAGTKITLTDSNGATVFEHTPPLPFSVVIISSPDIISGESYTIDIGTQNGEITAD